MKRGLPLLALIGLLLPVSAGAVLPSSLVPADTGFASNTVIDIIEHNSAIWLATSQGPNVSYDLGQSWLLHQNNDGMVSTVVSSMHSQSGRIWISTSHTEFVGGKNTSISDGLLYSDDDGMTWTQVPFGPDGLDIPWILGGYQTVYDITGRPGSILGEGWLFFGAWAGGLVASRDDGENWRRIYSSVADSIQYNDPYQVPSLRNMYFAAVADTSHGDTLMLWGGTAAGVLQYVFAPVREKLYANKVFSVAVCDLCADSTENFIYFGTDRGLSRTLITGGGYITTTGDSLPGSSVSAVFDFRDNLFVGTVDSLTGLSTGLAVSTDFGDSFTPISLAEVEVDSLTEIKAFASVGERLYLAGEAAGLFVSTDTGATWDRILMDSVTSASAINEAYSLDAVGDTLFVGTDSGLVRLNLAADGTIDSLMHFVFIEDIWSASRLRALTVKHFVDTSGAVDSVILWTANEPAYWPGGSYSLTRGKLMDSIDTVDVGPPVVADTIPILLQDNFLQDIKWHSVGFWGDTLFVGGDSGLWTNSLPGDSNFAYGPVYPVDLIDYTYGIVLDSDTIYALAEIGDKLIAGTSSATAITRDSTLNFKITKGNVDSLGADLVIQHTVINSLWSDSIGIRPGVAGDFVQALAVQYLSDGSARVWASGNVSTNGYGFQGISYRSLVPILDTLGDSVGVDFGWRAAYKDGFAWNYAFDGDSVVYAATNAGLLVNYDTSDVWDWEAWDTITIISDSGLELLGPDVPVFAVAVVDSNLWVGTSDGTIRQNLNDGTDRELFIVVDSTTPVSEVYAYPVPFSPGRSEEVHFRFFLETASDVSVEIYDFAMNLVARPIDDVRFEAGYHENPDSQRLTWNGLNGQGDLVAVGVYYFKVISSSGTRWGKLAVMP